MSNLLLISHYDSTKEIENQIMNLFDPLSFSYVPEQDMWNW